MTLTKDNECVSRKKLTKRQLRGLTQLKIGNIIGNSIQQIDEAISTLMYYDKQLGFEWINTVEVRMKVLRGNYID